MTYVKILHYKVKPKPGFIDLKPRAITLLQDEDGWLWFRHAVYKEMGEEFPISSKEEAEVIIGEKLELHWEKNIDELEKIDTPIKECVTLVLKFFEGDMEKTQLWFDTDNTLLGGMSPNTMIENGRTEKLLQFIKASLDGNLP